MNPDKKVIIDGLLEKVNASPYVLVVDYTGMTVPQFSELRNRLGAAGAECHVAKNTYVKKALAEAGRPDIGESLVGQTAFVTGSSEIFAAAKAIKNFEKEFKKPELKVGLLGDLVLDSDKLKAIADIPSREAILSQLLATILEPSTRIARVIQKKFNPDADSKKDEATEEAPAAEPAAEA
ncbi:50S ribosomal protein L10 [Luteolibacter flavescens]|uniref:Large ribosomal subunit protein uL10 n=1 Tax=Luteolibacter flavescens TaxID=1859460 RepID=A0ABT3FMA1_9BACT|nr:50S ribosomal protein L10 [Luteolibacter flavescens]MCW1884705.1 50S ribosomal protein L10 [Luteolibacter flavescens]